MWIVEFNGEPLTLLAGRPFLIGREQGCDVVVDSVSVSRHQLELEVNEARPDEVVVRVLSRAKSVINGDTYKLAKGESPQEHVRTDAFTVEFSAKEGSLSPVSVKSVPFKLCHGSSTLAKLGVLPQAADSSEADYCLYDAPFPDPQVAMARGKTVLTKEWLEYVKKKPYKVGKWLLDLDITEFEGVEPKSSRSSLLKGYTAVVYDDKDAKLVQAMGGRVIQDDIESRLAATTTPVFVVGRKMGDYPETARDQLLQSLLDVSTDKLRTFNYKKRDATPSETPEPSGRRKRRKYERKDKLHFFDIKTEEEPVVEQELPEKQPSPAETEPQPEEPIPEASLQVPATPETQVEVPATPEEPIVKAEPSETVADEEVASKSPEPRGIKRENSTELAPAKRGKFTAKVSLVNAIKQAKAQAQDSFDRNYGESHDDLSNDLRDLVIVETVDVPIRHHTFQTAQSFNEAYQGRRNFKPFKKVQKSAPIMSRSFVVVGVVDAEVTETHEGLNPAAETEEAMNHDFQGLFVDEEVPSQESAPAPARSRATRPSSRAPPATYTVDSDSDDDGPRFGFTRK
ncbi:hypothetical protein DICA0_E18976 [Diutina catenulata]